MLEEDDLDQLNSLAAVLRKNLERDRQRLKELVESGRPADDEYVKMLTADIAKFEQALNGCKNTIAQGT